MHELTQQGLADRADVDAVYVARLSELGIIRADEHGLYEEGSVRRTRVARLLEGAGISLEGIAAVVAGGQLSFEMIELATPDQFSSFGEETFGEVSERTGIPIELISAAREATGAGQPDSDERVREDELQVVRLIEYQLGLGIRPAMIERWLRVFGESLRRMAETESDWWFSDLVAPRLAAGQSWGDVAIMAGETSPEMSRRSDAAVLALFHAHQSHAWMRNILEGVESAVVAAGLQEPLARVPPAICFLDITGYTRLTDERGDEAAAALADQLARTVLRISGRHGGKAIKWLGDGVMFHFPDAGAGVVAALEMVRSAAEAGLPPAHVGIHAGPVLFQDGDYFGQTVNVAARIAEYARPGEVVVSRAVLDLAGGVEVHFGEIGTVELKGVSTALALFVASRTVP